MQRLISAILAATFLFAAFAVREASGLFSMLCALLAFACANGCARSRVVSFEFEPGEGDGGGGGGGADGGGG